MANGNVTSFIGFETSGDWTASDMAVFSSSVAGIYDSLLVIRVRRGMVEGTDRALRSLAEQLDHPMYFELLHEWSRVVRRMGKLPEGKLPEPWVSQFAFAPILGLLGYNQPGLPTDQSIFEQLDYSVPNRERLRVHRVRMSSPGGFSFTGLGDVVEQLRQLIKDLWFRNRQERQMGEIEIVRKYLDLRREHHDNHKMNLPSDPYLPDLVLRKIQDLRRLESDGLLKPFRENIDYLPEDQG